MVSNHHDLYNIGDSLGELSQTLTLVAMKLDGLFVNADAGFDSKECRNTCFEHGIFAMWISMPETEM